MGTQVGQDYNGEVFTSVVNIGHGLLSVVDGKVTGRLTYPGPQSGGLSSQEGDCSAIIAQMPWIVGPGETTDSPEPKAVQDPQGTVTTAGYTKRWRKSDGQIAVTPGWSYVGTDGEITTAPGGGAAPDKAAAAKAFDAALVTLAAAKAVLAK